MPTLLVSGSLVLDLDDKVTFDLRSTWNPTEPPMFYNATTELYPDVEERLTIGIKRNTLSGLKSLYRLRQDIADFEQGLSETPVTLHYTASGGGRTYRTRLTSLSLDVPPDFFRMTALNGIPNVGVTLTRSGRWIYQTITAFQTATSVYTTLVSVTAVNPFLGPPTFASQTQTMSGFSNLVVTFSGLGTAPVNSPTSVMVSGLKGALAAIVPNSILAVAGRVNPAIPAIFKLPLILPGVLFSSYFNDVNRRHNDSPYVLERNINNADSTWIHGLDTLTVAGLTEFLNTYPSISTYVTFRINREELFEFSIDAQWIEPQIPLISNAKQTNILSTKVTHLMPRGTHLAPQYMYTGTIIRNPSQTIRGLDLQLNTNVAPLVKFYLDDVFFVANTGQTKIMQLNQSDALWSASNLATLTVRDDVMGDERRSFVSIPQVTSTFEKPHASFGNMQTGTMSDVVDVVWIAPCTSGFAYTYPLGGTGYPQIQHIRIGIQRDNATILPGLE